MQKASPPTIFMRRLTEDSAKCHDPHYFYKKIHRKFGHKYIQEETILVYFCASREQCGVYCGELEKRRR
jgi:hypothetical protein